MAGGQRPASAHLLITKHQPVKSVHCFRVGGWTNPFGKYARQIGSFPQETTTQFLFSILKARSSRLFPAPCGHSAHIVPGAAKSLRNTNLNGETYNLTKNPICESSTGLIWEVYPIICVYLCFIHVRWLALVFLNHQPYLRSVDQNLGLHCSLP